MDFPGFLSSIESSPGTEYQENQGKSMDLVKISRNIYLLFFQPRHPQNILTIHAKVIFMHSKVDSDTFDCLL